MPPLRSPLLRVGQGLLLLVGAVVLELVVARGSLAFYWTPLIIGLTYLAAAVAGGRLGGYWATACVLTGWGIAVVFVGAARPTMIDTSGAYLLGAGLGAVGGALLARLRFTVGTLGLAATVAAGGLVLTVSPTAPEVLDDARIFAVALGLVGLFNVALGTTLGRRTRDQPEAGVPHPAE